MKSIIAVLLAVTAFCHAAPKQRGTGDLVGELSPSHVHNNDGIPASLDWRTKGVISPVQNRPRDISGSALIVMETVQSLHAIQTGQLLNLSLPQVLDCLGHSQIDNSFAVVTHIGGLCLQKDYPAQRNLCQAGECNVAAPVTSAGRTFTLQQMVTAIQKRPLMVFFDGSLPSFQSYTGGIYDQPGCNPNFTTNALQVVGYGTENGKDFWICKNNWGTSWGEKGYIRVVKGVNMCSIEHTGQYPIRNWLMTSEGHH